jgi:omega-hydroxy-beta-dihydromenaquinone-9 sulfotransferase
MSTAHKDTFAEATSSISGPSKPLDSAVRKKMDSLGSGGYTDKPWFLRCWDGMIATGWFPMLVRNRFRITPRRWAMAVLMSFFSLLNLGLWLLQEIFWGRRIARTQLQGDPIFVIGHWRSGTTLLHELLVLDGRHTCSNTYDCFCPNHFLLTAPVFRPLLKGLLPKQRPMDNMAMEWSGPQEDEFAMCNMGMRTPYTTIAFPNLPPQNQAFYELKDVSPRQLARWKRGLLWFLKCLTVRTPRRIVLKSPPHTFRIKVLLEMFPQARFIHIVRNPFVIFPSTINLWKRLFRNDGLQFPTYEGLDEYVFATLLRMYEVFERDRRLIPAGQFCEVRYEDLVARPVDEMRRVYEELRIDGFDTALPRIEAYFAQKADYKTNRYELPPELAEEISRRWASFFQRYGYSSEPC